MRPFETHKIVTTTPLSAARPNEPRNRFYIETFYFGGILVSMNANKANISIFLWINLKGITILVFRYLFLQLIG